MRASSPALRIAATVQGVVQEFLARRHAPSPRAQGLSYGPWGCLTIFGKAANSLASRLGRGHGSWGCPKVFGKAACAPSPRAWSTSRSMGLSKNFGQGRVGAAFGAAPEAAVIDKYNEKTMRLCSGRRSRTRRPTSASVKQPANYRPALVPENRNPARDRIREAAIASWRTSVH
jgi:hypothetical protein